LLFLRTDDYSTIAGFHPEIVKTVSMQDPSEIDALTSVRDLVRWGASRFSEAGLVYAHGTDNALDEAFFLVLHALHLPSDLPAIYLESRVTAPERQTVVDLLMRRIETRVPSAYLVGEIQFGGLPFYVDERVLVPRSPIAELIDSQFAPWLTAPPANILDLCAGSGCIGIACAYAFPDADVDLVDIDEGALSVCQRNIERHGWDGQVVAVRSNLFESLGDKVYDLIVSNPPYVPMQEWEALPVEFHREPRIALVGGDDGMDLVETILVEAPEHLSEGGLLVCEIGGSQEEFADRFPNIPVGWPEFENGGDGVFIIDREALTGWLARR